jgi:PAS domain S-box-containing protein
VPEEAARIRILHLEDDPQDCELVSSTLAGEGVACDIFVASSREAFEAALDERVFDVILADDWLPAFDGLAALAVARGRAPQLPFICVSGTMGEDIAVERLKAGATDYVLKHRLQRLPSAIRRAIAEAGVRAARERAEAEIRRLNADLERRVVERTSQLAEANAALAERELALRRSEEQLHAILDLSPAGIFLKDLEGRYRFVNRHFERDFGVDRATACGRTDRELFAPRLAEIYRDHDRRALAAGTVVDTEEPAMHGQAIRVHATSRFVLYDPDRQPYAVCGISVDVTDRKQAEDDLKAARLEAERANRAKNEFLSRMSHDLRTPLNAVIGFAQLLAADRLSAAQSECAEQILRGGRHLMDLINEVLDLARIESGRLALAPEPVAVRDAVTRAAELVAPLASQGQVTVRIDQRVPDLAVLADRQRLSQILLNLLSNAVKYNRTGGEVVLAVEERSPARARIVVSDTGPGIPPDKMRLLFRPFERLGAETTGIEGTGLGLTLSRRLAEAMGGELGVSSQVARGSQFFVELPTMSGLASATPRDEGGRSQLGTSATSPAGTVLYIEDHLSNVRLMQRLLENRPQLALVHASNGERGLALARVRRPDIILLDLHLPDQPGDHVLAALQADDELSDTPVVVLSADATPGQVGRLLVAGASEYLTKPLDLRQVLAVIDRLMARHASRTQRSARS